MRWGIDFVSGLISGLCGMFVGYPFDTIKCRMQTSRHEYKNFFTSFYKIFKEEGFFGLYKGISAPLINQFPINAM